MKLDHENQQKEEKEKKKGDFENLTRTERSRTGLIRYRFGPDRNHIVWPPYDWPVFSQGSER
jgi:hypothetical protein